MDSIKILVPVNIKAKLTDKLKNSTLERMQADLNAVDNDLRQIDAAEQENIQNINPQAFQDIQNIHAHYAQLRNENLNLRNQIIASIRNTEQLQVGTEIVQHQTNQIVELKVGDNIREINSIEILVEDDVVTQIRS